MTMSQQPRVGVRRSAAVGLAAVMTFSLATVAAPAATTAKLNGSCTKAGATATVSGKKLVCTKSGAKSVWKLAAAATTTKAAPTTLAATVTTAAPAASTPAAAVPADIDPNGILVVAQSIELPGGTAFDPVRSVTNADEPWIMNIYGSLMRATKDSGYDEWLAKSVDIVDAKTIKVTLNSGITFSDGASYDAAAVKDGMLRNFNTPNAAAKAGQNSLFKELASITVDGPLALTFNLKTPVAGEFLAVFAGRESAVPSPKAIASGVDLQKEPVGAGPFLFKEYKPSQIISLRKNTNFFQASRWRLNGFDFVFAPTATVGVAGLLSGSVQYTLVNPADAGRLESANRYNVIGNYTDYSYVVLTTCASKPPFDNIKVRQAMQVAFDRKQMNDFYARGRGTPAYGFWTDSNPNFNPNLKALASPDLDKARKLMKEAGVSSATVDLAYPSQINYQSLAELIQNQLDPIGLKVNITPLADVVTNFITAQKPGMLLVPGSRTGVDKVNRLFQAGQAQVMCGQPRPEISALTEQIAGLKPNDPKAVALWQKIDQINYDNAYAVFLINQPTIIGYNRNEVGGTPEFTPAKGWTFQNYESVYIKK